MRFREPLLIPALSLVAGIVASSYARFSPLELTISFATLLVGAIGAHLFAPRAQSLAWAACLLIAGVAIAELHRPGPPPRMDADSGDTLLLTGCVVEPLIRQQDRGRFTLEVEPGARVAVSIPMEKDIQLPYGVLVEFPARVRTPRNYGNPGAFDYVRYLARRKIFWLASVSPRAEIKIASGRCGTPLNAFIERTRAFALARLEHLYEGRPETAGFLRALLLGAEDRLDPETSDEFRRTGTFHAIVISGLHISLVAGSVLWALRHCFVPMLIRLPIAAFLAWAYAILAGGQAPVGRAALGFTLALIAMGFYRRVQVLNILAAVAICYLVVDPDQIFEASFQLSFAAVAAIGALAGPIAEATAGALRRAKGLVDRNRPSSKTPVHIASLTVELRLLGQTIQAITGLSEQRSQAIVLASCTLFAWLGEMMILSAGVQFALLLPAVLYFHRFPTTSVIANLFAVPLLNGAVGLGLPALVTGSRWLAWSSGALVEFAVNAIHRLAAIEPDWRMATPSPVLAIAFLLALCFFALALRRSWTPLAGIPAIVLACMLVTYEKPQGAPNSLEFTSIDVGQGDSLLLVFPDGRTMLIDGGGFPVFKNPPPIRRMDIGEQVVSPYLWSRGIRRLDIVAMTHAHDDHAQGLEAILKSFRPRELWTGATPSPSPAIVKEAHHLGIPVVQPRSGESRQFGAAIVNVLAPSQDYIAAQSAKNNDSLVLEVTLGHRRFILTGDAERQVELDMVTRHITRHTDVLKVGHHGSRTSTTPDLLSAISPTFAMFSVGEGNLYGHPHPDVVSRLQQAHVQMFRTDQSGLTTFKTDGNRLTVETNSIVTGQ